MKHRYRGAVALILCLAAIATPAKADGPILITNAGVSLNADDVHDVFLGEKQMAGVVRLVPVDNASAQEAFLSGFMKLDAAKYSTVWTKKSFRDGLNPPPVKASDGEVIDFVKRTPGAVGYVKSAPAGGANVVK